jgi:hypothetical protein
MTVVPHHERRRAPRREVVDGELAVLPWGMSVQVLDISTAGVLVQSPQSARTGATGRLTLTLAGQPFTADVEVRRVVSVNGSSDCRLGMVFTDLSADHQRTIERFTDQRTS